MEFACACRQLTLALAALAVFFWACAKSTSQSDHVLRACWQDALYISWQFLRVLKVLFDRRDVLQGQTLLDLDSSESSEMKKTVLGCFEVEHVKKDFDRFLPNPILSPTLWRCRRWDDFAVSSLVHRRSQVVDIGKWWSLFFWCCFAVNLQQRQDVVKPFLFCLHWTPFQMAKKFVRETILFVPAQNRWSLHGVCRFYILSLRGDTIITRDFRGDVVKGTAEIFFRKVSWWYKMVIRRIRFLDREAICGKSNDLKVLWQLICLILSDGLQVLSRFNPSKFHVLLLIFL